MSEQGTGVYVYQQIVKTTADWAADASVWPENIWLFEKRVDGKIIVKLSDGLHSYSNLPQKMIDAYEAAQEGGYEGTVEEFYESLGTIDEKVKEAVNLVESLEGKYAETPTLTDKPTWDTIVYTIGEITRNFAIGQQCRVYDENIGDYIFYQLYDLTADGKADWRIVSSDTGYFLNSSIVFDKSISDPQNISGDINSGAIKIILEKFRRCLCKKTGEGQVTISYLKDNNSNYYEDGSTAALDGTEGDVMVDFPEFFYKWEKVDENRFRYRFALHKLDDSYKHISRSLLGAYKCYILDDKMYSRSGVTPTVSKSTTQFEAYATARGAGYQRIDFQQHCVIAFMLYAKYGNRNLQAVLGAGGALYNSNNTTGSTNSIGNSDTVKETANYVNGLAVEGVFGCLYEWTKGVVVNNHVWTITDPDGSVRKVTAAASEGWITKVAAENGPFFDMVPTAGGGSETTHYSDYHYCINGGPFVLLRSYNSSYPHGGVAYANTNNDASHSNADCGSRLAFRGVIREAESVSAFKALPVL